MRTRSSSSSPFSLFAFQDIITSVIAIVILVTMILTLELVNRIAQAPQNATVISTEDIRAAEDRQAKLTKEIDSLKRQVNNTPINVDLLPSQNTNPQDLERQIKRLTEQLAILSKKESSIDEGPTKPALPLNELQMLADNIKLTQKKIAIIQTNNPIIYAPVENNPKTCWLIALSSQTIKLIPIQNGLPAKTIQKASRKELLEELNSILSSLEKRKHYFLLSVRPSAGPDLYFEVLDLLQSGKYPVGVEFIPENVNIFTQANFTNGTGL